MNNNLTATAIATFTAGALSINGNTLTLNGTIAGAGAGTISGSATSNLLLGGNAAGNMGTAYFTSAGAAVLNNLTLDRAGTTPFVTFGGSTGLTINGTLAIGTTNVDNTVDMGLNSLTLVGSGTGIAATGTLKTQNTSATAIPVGKTWTGTVWYSSSSQQTIINGNYTNLTGTNGNRILSASGTIGIAAVFTKGAGAYTVTNSTVDFNGSVNQNIPAFTFENLIISNGATTKTLLGNVAIQTSLSINNTTALQLAAFNLSLLSTASQTARLNAVTGGGSILYGGTGLVFVQRYLPARRAWRLLAAPLKSTGGTHTISEAWQERGKPTYTTGLDYTAANYVASIAADTIDNTLGKYFSTQITGGAIGNGFDQSPTNASSIKYYSAGSWLTPVDINNISVNSQEGWMLFVRGDRKNYGEITGNGKAPTITTLRPRGQINIGTKAITASGTTVVGNPYASAVDYNSMVRTGAGIWPINPTYYMWDPYLGGANGAGAFVTLTWNGTDFTRSVPSTIDNRYIPSGAAIIVDFPAGGGTLTFNETDKNAANITLAFRPAKKQLMTVLTTVNADNFTYVSDGVLSLFDETYRNEADVNDVNKPMNFAENFAVKRDSRVLSVERRQLVAEVDTIFYNMSKMQAKKYRLQFIMDDLGAPATTAAFLEDLYLKKKTPVNMQDTSYVDFALTTNETAAPDRFRLIFRKSVTYSSIAAAIRNSDVLVSWKLADELNINHYEIERSQSNSNFRKIGTVASNGNSDVAVNYSFNDEGPAPGIYFYRVKSISNNGIISYSESVKVKLMKSRNEMYVFPNPVIDGNIQLQMPAASVSGVYNTRLFNANGQLVFKGIVNHTGGVATLTVKPAQDLMNGNYQMEVTGPDRSIKMIPVFVSNQ